MAWRPNDASHRIVFGGRDQPTAEFVCRLGGGLILPEDVTGLARDHAIVLSRAGGEDLAARVIFHGTPTPFSKREDWQPGQAPWPTRQGRQLKSITVIPRSPNARAQSSQPSGRPHSPPKRAEPTSSSSIEPAGGKTKGRAPAYDAIERLLADAPESDRKKDRDLWTNENW